MNRVKPGGQRRQISVRGEVYDRLKAERQRTGLSIHRIVETIVADVSVPKPAITVEVYRRKRIGVDVISREFTCAVCASAAFGIPTREPFGRDNAMVDVCSACEELHPRSGRYNFDAPAPMPSGKASKHLPGAE